MTSPEQAESSLLNREDKRDIVEAAVAAAVGFATLDGYVKWREQEDSRVKWFEKFIVMFVATGLAYLLIRLITKAIWPLPGETS